MRRRMYTPNYARNDEAVAEEIRETFTDRPAEKRTNVSWRWPRTLQEVGQCVAVMYSSDKWKAGRGKNWAEDYKHVAEGEQWILVRPGFLVEDERPSQEIPVCGPKIELGPMPTAFAVLADVLGAQLRLYRQSDLRGTDGSAAASGDLYQTNVARAKLGGARFPDNDEPFLFIYTAAGVEMIIVGRELAIEKDGITG